MSRTADALNRLEHVAYKMKISVEDVLDILEGKHHTHTVMVRKEVLAVRELPQPVKEVVKAEEPQSEFPLIPGIED